MQRSSGKEWNQDGGCEVTGLVEQMAITTKRILFWAMHSDIPRYDYRMRLSHVQDVKIDSNDYRIVHIESIESAECYPNRPANEKSTNKVKLRFGPKRSSRLVNAILRQVIALRFRLNQPEVDELRRFYAHHSGCNAQNEPLIRNEWSPNESGRDRPSIVTVEQLCRVHSNRSIDGVVSDIQCGCCEGSRIVFSQMFGLPASQLIGFVFDDRNGLLLQAKQRVQQQTRMIRKWHLMRSPLDNSKETRCVPLVRVLRNVETKWKHLAGSDTIDSVERQNLCTCASPDHFSVMSRTSSRGTCSVDSFVTHVRFCVTSTSSPGNRPIYSGKGSTGSAANCEMHVALHIHLRRWMLARPLFELELFERTLQLCVILADLINDRVLIGNRFSIQLPCRELSTIDSIKRKSSKSNQSLSIGRKIDSFEPNHQNETDGDQLSWSIKFGRPKPNRLKEVKRIISKTIHRSTDMMHNQNKVIQSIDCDSKQTRLPLLETKSCDRTRLKRHLSWMLSFIFLLVIAQTVMYVRMQQLLRLQRNLN